METIDPSRIALIWTFVRVVDEGSLTGAAAAMGLSVSAVSKQLARLENELGMSLLTRTTRSIRPTEAGARMSEKCRHLVDAFAEAEQAARSATEDFSGLIHVTASPAFGRTMLAGILARFASEHPKLDFKVTLSGEPLGILEHAVDVAIREGELRDSSMIARRLGKSRTLFCAAPAYLGRKRRPKTIEDLSGHALLLPDSPPSDRLAKKLLGKNARGARFRINDLLTARDLACEGLGIAALPDFAAHDAVADGRLIETAKEASAAIKPRPIHAVYAPRKALPGKIRALLDCLASEVPATLARA